MQQPILLKRFEYSIPPSALAMAGLNQKHESAKHLPLLTVHIDFEQGNLIVEGDWHFMVNSNRNNNNKWLNYHTRRVVFETIIYPVMAINLSDPNCDGLLFPIDGYLKDGLSAVNVSGLLILENKRTKSGNMSNCWNISFYIYDYQFDVCEVKFKLPLYVNTAVDENNN